MASADDENGGVLAANEDLVAQYQSTKIRAMGWASYKRIFQLTKMSILTLDPNTFSVTNTFPYENISNIALDEKNPEQFTFDVDKTACTFRTTYRENLVCQLYECVAKRVPNKLKSIGPIECERLRKNGTHVDCKLLITFYGIIEQDPYENVLQEYKWVNFSRCGTDDSSNGFFFEYSGRTKIFLSGNIDRLINACRSHLRLVGKDKVPILMNQPLTTIIKYRADKYAAVPSAVSIFDVNKITRRSVRPIPRQLHISELYIKETDSSGFQVVSYQKVESIYAIVRCWGSQREFKIEYDDGSSRLYTSTVRDTLLAMLLDVCHATGNVRVIVTGEVSDGLRLMPRFAEEDYKASIKDAFFGASSIEAWYLGRLTKIFKATTVDNEAVIQACRELNANVPCPGISPNTDLAIVKLALTGVLGTIQSELIKAFHNERLDNSRELAIMLQTLFRLIPCVHGYKAFVEVKEVDTRQLLLQLLRYDHDFVHYWTLEVLMVLCRCPLEPRNMQQEFVNKHTLLTDKMLRYLTDLMYYKSEEEEDAERSNSRSQSIDITLSSESAASAAATAATAATAASVAAVATSESRKSTRVAANPGTAAHIPIASFQRDTDSTVGLKSAAPAAATGGDAVHFTPNALLVIGAASLLESLISSRRDTSSPELMNQVLDLLAERCDVLINMLRSTSFLIMENASILMFALLKNRTSVAPLMRELALSECLVLKNFYNAVFSPSASQRFISRFLIATWMSGPEKTNPAKALLTRMIPSGLIEYLKFAAITEEQRKNLDLIENDFYAMFANAGGGKGAVMASGSDLLQNRMRKRIGAAIKEKAVDAVQHHNIHQQLGGAGGNVPGMPSTPGAMVPSTAPPAPPTPLTFQSPVKSSNSGEPAVKKLPENYRIMFHIMTQDHKLPDLIWSEQTRLELRTALETEIKEYDREQRLQGSKKIAWNFQQFFVKYESLREELQVGPIYIRYFLEAGDAFLKSLENPNHIVLFEKLFRRVLVNLEHQPSLSILCVRCLTRLYEVCGNIVGTFDDMLIMVRMLEQASNLELQQYLLDLLVALSLDESNLRQLLDKAFVNTMIKYVTLAHINPDQIGNALARATANVLLIKDGYRGTPTEENDDIDAATVAAAAAAVEGRSEEDIAKQVRRSLWVPEDQACPKVWYAAPPGKVPPPKTAQKGPYRVSELLDEVELGRVGTDWVLAALTTEESDDARFDVLVDTGRWKTLNDYFQLKLQMLFPGKAIYSPAQVAAKSLKLLQRLASIHRASNTKGVPFYPIPMSKKIMSEPSHLNIFAQLLLSNDPNVVDNAADLLRSLVEYNSGANSKLYLSGAFFFAARYTGNNYLPLALLFHVTHLRQSFHDSAASVARDLPIGVKSILGTLFPQAMISILHNYGPERFASVHTGEFDTPEVIWNATLRRFLVEMVDQHLGDFPARLRQYTMASYEYVPLAKIHYAALDKEIYVHEYYLRNLCDETKFADWPIAEPLVLLRECIQRWREEMAKGIVDTSIGDAKKVLKLGERFDNAQLRRAYKNLAREFHPDKNPQGREMFEKIQVAYELLSKVELQSTETNLHNVYLLMQTQNILYRRFPEKIGDQKYPAYPLIVEVLRIPPEGEVVSGLDADLLVAASKLLFYTTSVSPLNAKEFVRAGVVTKLYALFSYAVSLRNVPGADVLFRDLLVHTMKTFTAVVNIEEGRAAVVDLCPSFAENVYNLLSLKKIVPLAVENGVEVIARCCTSPVLQRFFIEAGVIWRLIPLLLEYDNTYTGDYQDESQRVAYNQVASNVLAIVGAKALGRLGGYMFDELQSTVQEDVKGGLACILTQPLASLLRNRRPWDLLSSLNENVETTTKIWNVAMRQELTDFISKIDGSRAPGSNPQDLAAAQSFVFSNLREELCINGVYVRIFNKTTDTNDILDPSQFCRELLDFVHDTVCVKPDEGTSSPAIATVKNFQLLTTLQRVHVDYAAEALHILAEAKPYIPGDIAAHSRGLDTVMLMLDLAPESAAFAAATRLLILLFADTDYVAKFAAEATTTSDASSRTNASTGSKTMVWRLLKCLSTVDHPHVLPAWAATEALVANPLGLQALLEAGAVARILGSLLAVTGYVNSYASRMAAISLLSKMLWNQVKGNDAFLMLSRFLPRPVVVLLRNQTASSAALQIIDTLCENPELIWTAEMQGELRTALIQLLGPVTDASVDVTRGFQRVPKIDPDYAVNYRQLASELYLGGVYIRLYLKQPTFRLSNPVFFMEKVTDFWESSFTSQVPLTTQTQQQQQQAAADSTEVILGKEDFLSLLTSCMICVIKAESSIIDHLLSWGFLQKCLELLQRALRGGRRGTPLLSIVRLLHQLISRGDVVDSLAMCRGDLVSLLKDALDDGSSTQLPKDATVFVELLKRLFQCTTSRYLPQCVESAHRCNLPNFILDRVLGADAAALSHVLHPAALRIHAVDLLKAILAADPEREAALQALLNLHPAWRDYRDQSHDLFLTDKEKTDVYLIQDASDAKFANLLLLTDGSAENSKMVNMFPSSGIHADRGTATSGSNSSSSAASRKQSKFSTNNPSENNSNGGATQPSGATTSAAATSVNAPVVPPPPVPSASTTASASSATTAAPSAPPRPTAPAPSIAQHQLVTTTVVKNEHGMGLDLAKSKEGKAVVSSFKELPAGAINPALQCVPPIKPGDVIVGVNGENCETFAEAVKLIRASSGAVTLRLFRA